MEYTKLSDTVEVADKTWKGNVYTFKMHIHVASAEVFIDGYLDIYNHFRIEAAHSAGARDLALCLAELTLWESFYVEKFKHVLPSE